MLEPRGRDLNAQPDEPAVKWLKAEERAPRFFSAYERSDGSEPGLTTWKIRSGAFKPGERRCASITPSRRRGAR